MNRGYYIFIISIAALMAVCSAGFSAEDQRLILEKPDTPGRQYELQVRYFHEEYSYAPDDTDGVTGTIIYRIPGKYVLLGEVTHQKKFDFDENLFSVGGGYHLTDRLTIQEIIGFSSGSGTFSKFYNDTELVYTVLDPLALHLNYKLSIFEDVNAHVISTGVTYTLVPYMYIHGKWFHAIADFDAVSDNGTSDSFLVKTGIYPHVRHELFLYYVHGSSSFLSVEDIGEAKLDTYGMGWNFNIHENWWLVTGFSYGRRRDPSKGEETRVDIGFSYRK